MQTNLDKLISSQNWTKALMLLQSDKELELNNFRTLGLIYFNLQQFEISFENFEKACWKDFSDCAWLLSTCINPSIKIPNYHYAEKLLSLVLKHHPQSIDCLSILSRLLIKQNRRRESSIYLEKILDVDKENYIVAAQLVQIHMQNDQLDKAIRVAENYQHAYKLNQRLFQMSLLAFSKARKFELCMQQITSLDYSTYPTDFSILCAQIAFKGKNHTLAQEIIHSLLRLAIEDSGIYLILAQLTLELEHNNAKALDYLKKALILAPASLKIQSLLGDLLLKMGRFNEALEHLSHLKKNLPDNTHTRLLHARALKFTGLYTEAANELLDIIQLQPNSIKLIRYTTSALIQAKRLDEATELFNKGIHLRDTHLGSNFDQGIKNLLTQIETVNIPQARLDWLWAIIQNNSLGTSPNRSEYEKEAKRIHLLDHYLIDWLECRPHKADEPMAFFDDLSSFYEILHSKLNEKKGVLLAGAHIGPLFAIPLALELIGLPHKWLASTPSISSMLNKESLISTSDQTETEVVRRIIKALGQKEIIALAVDGSINPAAPKINFENQQISYSDFAAKMVFRTEAPSFFVNSYWENERFHVALEPLPTPLSKEESNSFCLRWTQNYLLLLRNYLIKKPSNARLSGGIWRFIKPINN